MENQIDDFFRKRLERAEVSAPKNSWESLQDRLHHQKINRQRFQFAAAFLSASILAGGWLWFSSSNQKSEVLAQEKNSIQIKRNLSPSLNNPPASNGPLVEAINSRGNSIKNSITNILESESATENEVDDVADDVLLAEVLVTDLDSNEKISSSSPNHDQIKESLAASIQQPETEVIIYELNIENNMDSQDGVHNKLVRAVFDLKREGISLGAVRGLKNDFFGKLSRIRQKVNFQENKFESTEQ